MANRILIVDYGMGNLHSVRKKLIRLGVDPVVSSDPDEVIGADKLILPGVGHFAKAMENLISRDLVKTLTHAALYDKKPILGICLGMQLMAKRSEEGESKGLGWFDMDVMKFAIQDSRRFKVPHIGWNTVRPMKNSQLTSGLPDNPEFYFVHAYHCRANNERDVLHETNYEFTFTSAIEKDNIFGVQYHPEKSHEAGERLLRNFVDI